MHKTDFYDAKYTEGHCPLQRAIAAIANNKWKLRIVLHLIVANRPVRYVELERALRPVSRKVATSALRGLQGDGLIDRFAYNEIPPRVEYALTKDARGLIPILSDLNAWAENTTQLTP